MKNVKKLTNLFILLSCISCTQAKEVSILEYTEVNKKFVTSKKYLEYQIGNKRVLLDPDSPDKIFVVQDGKIVGFFGNNYVKLFATEKSYPLEDNVVVTYFFTEPAIQYNSKNTIYFDKGLNGIDIESEKMIFKENEKNIIRADLGIRSNISKAFIESKQCLPLIKNIACCIQKDNSYSGYIFKKQIGWLAIPDNKKVKMYCNSEDLIKTREELKQSIFYDK